MKQHLPIEHLLKVLSVLNDASRYEQVAAVVEDWLCSDGGDLYDLLTEKILPSPEEEQDPQAAKTVRLFGEPSAQDEGEAGQEGGTSDSSIWDQIENIPAEPAGQYQIKRVLGWGAQARVEEVYDQRLERVVALKEKLTETDIRAVLTSRSGYGRETTALLRFLREAKITGQLEHPGILPVYELGRRQDGQPYYTMRLVRGKNLALVLAQTHRLDDRLSLLSHFLDVCHAVAYAHSRGVIHRDIKPANIMIGEFGETILLDWGVCKVKGMDDLQGPDMARQVRLMHHLSREATLPGTALGTPVYMSPEQARGELEEVDERSDVWGLGMLLYEMLAGKHGIRETDVTQVVKSVALGEVRPFIQACPDAPGELVAIVDKALQSEKKDRYQSVKDMADDTRAYLTGKRVVAYEYSSMELARRFVARNKVALSVVCLLAVFVLGMVLAARYQQSLKVRDHIAELARQSDFLDVKYASWVDTRKKAFEAFDREEHRDGESHWRQAYLRGMEIEGAFLRQWTRLESLLDGRRDLEEGQILRTRLLMRLKEVCAKTGKKELSNYYAGLLPKNVKVIPAQLTLLSTPQGAHLELYRTGRDKQGLARSDLIRTLGDAPVVGLALEPGSYRVEARLKGRETARMPFVLESGGDQVLTLVLPPAGSIPEDMVYVPAGEFLQGTDSPEVMRRHTSRVPLHRSYLKGFVISKREVTFADYLPFLRDLDPELKADFGPREPFKLEIGDRGSPRLTYKGIQRSWGEKFQFEDCTACEEQDWRRWPVVVSLTAAEAYARWKNDRLATQGIDLVLRLPSEQEWEKAARGADGRIYPCGDSLPATAALTWETHGRGFNGVEEAGSRPQGRSQFGLDDMAGNVWEWVRLRPGGHPDAVAIKGGSFRDRAYQVTASSRVPGTAVSASHVVGFRLAADLPGADPCQVQENKKYPKGIASVMLDACIYAATRSYLQADTERALSRFQVALQLSLELPDRDDLQTAKAHAGIGDCFRALGNCELALQSFEQALALRRRVLGEQHPETAANHNRIGACHWDLGAVEPARESFEKALGIYQETKGPDHFHTSTTYDNLAALWSKQAKFDKALFYANKSLEIKLRIYGAQHLKTALTYTALSNIYWDMGELERALEFDLKSHGIRLSVVGEDHPLVANSFSNLAVVYLGMGNQTKARQHGNRALEIRLKTLGKNHPDTATSHDGLCNLYFKMRDFKKALHHCRAALAIREQVYGKEHPKVALSLNNLASIALHSGSLEGVLEGLNRALKIVLKRNGPGHPNTAYLYLNIGAFHCHVGHDLQAREPFEKAVNLRMEALGPEHKATVVARFALANLLVRLGEQPAASLHFQGVWEGGSQACVKGDLLSCSLAAMARCQLNQCDQQAAQMAERAARESPDDVDILEARAFVLLRQGKLLLAKEAYCAIKAKGHPSRIGARKRVEQNCP